MRGMGRMPIPPTAWVRGMGRMPISPTAWDAWYGQDAHTSYGVGCVVWAGCPYLLIYEHNFKQNIWQRKRRSAKPLILKKQ